MYPVAGGRRAVVRRVSKHRAQRL